MGLLTAVSSSAAAALVTPMDLNTPCHCSLQGAEARQPDAVWHDTGQPAGAAGQRHQQRRPCVRRHTTRGVLISLLPKLLAPSCRFHIANVYMLA